MQKIGSPFAFFADIDSSPWVEISFEDADVFTGVCVPETIVTDDIDEAECLGW